MNFSQEQVMGWVVMNQDIPTAEMEQDIADTEREIATMKREVEAFSILAETGDRMADMKRLAREHGIQERELFVAKLKAVIEARNLLLPSGDGEKVP